jgi:hypothetical protein
MKLSPRARYRRNAGISQTGKLDETVPTKHLGTAYTSDGFT